jgi:hypothetical protein
MKWLKDILTEKDNETFEFSALLAFLSVLVFIGLSVWKMWTIKQFDPISYGTGASAIIGGGGLSRLFKGRVGDYSNSKTFQKEHVTPNRGITT